MVRGDDPTKAIYIYPDEDDTYVAIAPRLTRKLSREEWEKPVVGTLIFHPSLLPLLAGPDAVWRAIREGHKVTGATWFWAADGLDKGDICEQEIVHIPEDISPSTLYHGVIVPAGCGA